MWEVGEEMIPVEERYVVGKEDVVDRFAVDVKRDVEVVIEAEGVVECTAHDGSTP